MNRRVDQVLAGLPKEAVRSVAADRELLRGAEDFLRSRFPGWKRPSLKWHVAYAAANGIRSPHYLPLDIFYNYIEPRMNPCGQRQVLSDKNFYSVFPFGDRTPNVVARVIDNRLMAGDYAPVSVADLLRIVASAPGPLIMKPSVDTGGGRNVTVGDPEAVAERLKAAIDSIPSAGHPVNLVVQELVRQSPEMAALNPSSVNTIRVITVRTRQRVQVASAVVRIGRAGSVVDNFASGGVVAAVGLDEVVGPRAYFKNFAATETHPDSGVRFAQMRLPGFWQAAEECTRFHASLPHMDVVSWDIALEPGPRARIIEINLRMMDLSLHQLPRGPVFAVAVLDEILDHLRAKGAVAWPAILPGYVRAT